MTEYNFEMGMLDIQKRRSRPAPLIFSRGAIDRQPWRGRILVVDHSVGSSQDPCSQILVLALERFGYHCERTNIQDLVSKPRPSLPYDFLIMDKGPGSLSVGFDFLKKLVVRRSDGMDGKDRIIYWTPVEGSEDMETEFFGCSARRVWSRSMSLDELSERIYEEMIQGQRVPTKDPSPEQPKRDASRGLDDLVYDVLFLEGMRDPRYIGSWS